MRVFRPLRMGQGGLGMKRRHHSPEHIIRNLREAARMLGEGKQIPEVAKELQISEATFSPVA